MFSERVYVCLSYTNVLSDGQYMCFVMELANWSGTIAACDNPKCGILGCSEALCMEFVALGCREACTHERTGLMYCLYTRVMSSLE